MGFFEKLVRKKAPNSATAKKSRAMELHGQAIKYVTERVNDNDNVVGRGGSISVRNGQLLLFSSDKILLRADIGKENNRQFQFLNILQNIAYE